MKDVDVRELISSLILYPKETEWIEFKENNLDPEELGQIISGLSNTALLHEKDFAYLIYGIENETHSIVGTNISIKNGKKGGEELEHRLMQRLSPKINIEIYEGDIEKGKKIVLISIPKAIYTPSTFQKSSYIRIGSINRNLKDFAEIEKKLRTMLGDKNFETQIAGTSLSVDEILTLVDYPSYFKLMQIPLPENKSGIIEKLKQEGFIIPISGTKYNISNLCAILFANDIKVFPSTKRKGVRVIVYKGKDKTETIKEQEGGKGYASGFSALISYIVDRSPGQETIRGGLRHQNKISEIIIRELIANAIIHQDFLETGTGPMVEIFSDRIEITNPGKPLIKTDRFLDHSPKSRNEDLAAFMRRINICEERGSGIDKVIWQCEVTGLPAPDFEEGDNFTRIVVYTKKQLTKMTEYEKVKTLYRHCVLKFVRKEYMTNTSLRERFGISEENHSIVSRLIGKALEKNIIKQQDPDNKSKKHSKYVPFWA